MEWTPARIRLLRDVGLCESQHDFAKTLGVAKRTVGNAERGTHPPSLALRRALDEALKHASDAQRDRFRTAVAAHDTTPAGARSRSTVASGQPPRTLDGLRSAVLGMPPAVSLDVNGPVTHRSTGSETATTMTATVQAHRLYQMADYEAAAQLVPAVLTGLQRPMGTDSGHDECLPGTLTTRHATAAAYLVAAKLATKLGDVVLASVTAHLLEAERVAEQAVSRNASTRTLLDILLARERRSVTPGLRGLASRAGLLP